MKNQWFIAVKKRGKDIFDFSNMSAIMPPTGRYYADPFLYDHDGKTYVFIEDYDYKKGVISCFELNDDLSYTEPKIVLERNYHISYPFLYKEGNELYMIPETGMNQQMELFKCKEFPNKWEFVKPLFKSLMASDINILENQGLLYLTTTIKPDFDNNCALFIAKDSILNEFEFAGWEYIKDSRPAGNVFIYDGEEIPECKGKLIQPTQNCGERYGYGMKFRELNVTEDQYDNEKIIHEIWPDWTEGIIGTHTFNFNDKFVITDGKRRINE